MTQDSVAKLLTKFGQSTHTKLATGLGEPEEQLRAPFETLLGDLAQVLGLSVTIVGEAHLPEERSRPDYAVTVPPDPLPVGFVELKAPGVGSAADRFKGGHDKAQWTRLRVLPNLLYCDGNSWSLYRSGEKVRVARLDGDLLEGPALHDHDSRLMPLVSDFLDWEPKAPASAGELVSRVAGLCRLLRGEIEELVVTSEALQSLANDWRKLLFPLATDAQFADGYAQAVTFALLLARAEGIDFSGRTITEISHLLGKKHSLMGRRVLLESACEAGDHLQRRASSPGF